jgi:hypothetical protein
LMLCQLVCTDRRYQRMNCFNIRELQGILKRRFFTDLVNSSDYRDVLDSSMIGLRYKTNNNLSLNHDALSFYNFGTTTSDKFRTADLFNSYSTSITRYNMFSFVSNSSLSVSGCLHSGFLYLSNVISSFFSVITSLNFTSLVSY